MQGNDGALYGTTSFGGASNAGTVFRLNKDGTGYSVIHSFGSTAGDGSRPAAGLVFGADDVLYGTTGANYRLDVFTNLSDWVPLGTVFNESRRVSSSMGMKPKLREGFTGRCGCPDLRTRLPRSGDPNGNRTHATAVKGRCPNR